MKPSEALNAHRAAIRRVIESHRAGNARVFGSALRGDDSEQSDLDLLIDPTPETTLFDIDPTSRFFDEISERRCQFCVRQSVEWCRSHLRVARNARDSERFG